MPRKKKARGRPVTSYALPPRVDATADELVKAFFRWKPTDTQDFPKVYYCAGCKKQVTYPETLYRDGRCAKCTKATTRRQKV